MVTFFFGAIILFGNLGPSQTAPLPLNLVGLTGGTQMDKITAGQFGVWGCSTVSGEVWFREGTENDIPSSGTNWTKVPSTLAMQHISSGDGYVVAVDTTGNLHILNDMTARKWDQLDGSLKEVDAYGMTLCAITVGDEVHFGKLVCEIHSGQCQVTWTSVELTLDAKAPLHITVGPVGVFALLAHLTIAGQWGPWMWFNSTWHDTKGNMLSIEAGTETLWAIAAAKTVSRKTGITGEKPTGDTWSPEDANILVKSLSISPNNNLWVILDNGTVAVHLLDPCNNRQNPCMNDGVCSNDKLAEPGYSFSCRCLPFASGKVCDLTPCDKNPCDERAVGCTFVKEEHPCHFDPQGCDNQTFQHRGFLCTCPSPFYGGDDCTKELNPCDDAPCQYGGTCTFHPHRKTGFTCECRPHFYGGRTCASFLSPCAYEPCQNGGRCSFTAGQDDNFTCTCPTWASGPVCEVSTDPQRPTMTMKWVMFGLVPLLGVLLLTLSVLVEVLLQNPETGKDSKDNSTV